MYLHVTKGVSFVPEGNNTKYLFFQEFLPDMARFVKYPSMFLPNDASLVDVVRDKRLISVMLWFNSLADDHSFKS